MIHTSNNNKNMVSESSLPRPSEGACCSCEEKEEGKEVKKELKKELVPLSFLPSLYFAAIGKTGINRVCRKLEPVKVLENLPQDNKT